MLHLRLCSSSWYVCFLFISLVVDRVAQRLGVDRSQFRHSPKSLEPSRRKSSSEMPCKHAGTQEHLQSHVVTSLKRCSSEVLQNDWFKPRNGEYLFPSEMYIVRWVDKQDLPAASILFTKTVSSNMCTIRHVMSQIDTNPKCLARCMHKDTNCLKLVCSNANHEDNLMFSQVNACKRINIEEAWEIIEQWHYEAGASKYHWYQFSNRFFIDAPKLQRSPLFCMVHFEKGADGIIRPKRRPIKTKATKRDTSPWSYRWAHRTSRCRYEWLMEALSELHAWLPLFRITADATDIPKIATPTVNGRSRFADMYVMKLNKSVPEFVEINNYTPTELEIWATLFSLRDWWSQKMQKGLPGWTGFWMTQQEIDDLMHQVIFSLSIRFSILPRLANLIATVNDETRWKCL